MYVHLFTKINKILYFLQSTMCASEGPLLNRTLTHLAVQLNVPLCMATKLIIPYKIWTSHLAKIINTTNSQTLEHSNFSYPLQNSI